MAIAIEMYHVSGAIALAGIYDYASLNKLIEQTATLRKDPKEIEKEETINWMEENKDAQFVLTNEDGSQTIIDMEDFL